ncbi:hypothetical protein ACWC09_18650 [Streptomyces sp. NPDC001617]
MENGRIRRGGACLGEPVVVKHYPSSLFKTDLDAQLRQTGRNTSSSSAS